MALLLAGLLVVQRPWRLLGSGREHRAGAGFALLTGMMIATYSSLDTVGVGLTPSWLYAGILWPVCGAGLLVVAWVRPRVAGGAFAAAPVPLDLPRAVLGGFLTFIAYAMVLAALSRAPLAIIAPLRESAVLLASAWGVIRLREAAGRREIGTRITGVRARARRRRGARGRPLTPLRSGPASGGSTGQRPCAAATSVRRSARRLSVGPLVTSAMPAMTSAVPPMRFGVTGSPSTSAPSAIPTTGSRYATIDVRVAPQFAMIVK